MIDKKKTDTVEEVEQEPLFKISIDEGQSLPSIDTNTSQEDVLRIVMARCDTIYARAMKSGRYDVCLKATEKQLELYNSCMKLKEESENPWERTQNSEIGRPSWA